MPDEPILLVVRGGAHHRFAELERKTAHLDVKVIWDRRQRTQRQCLGDVRHERRGPERRSRSSASWQLADFAVSVPKSPPSSE